MATRHISTKQSQPASGKPVKVNVPCTRDELHKGLDMILRTRTVNRAFGEVLLQALWVTSCQSKAEQVRFASELRGFLDEYVAARRREGGAA